MKWFVCAILVLLGTAAGVWAATLFLTMRGQHGWGTSIVPIEQELRTAAELLSSLRQEGNDTAASAAPDSAASPPEAQASVDSVVTESSLDDALAHLAYARDLAAEGISVTTVEMGELAGFVQLLLMIVLALGVAGILGTDSGRAILQRAGVSSLPFLGGAIVLDSPAGGERIEKIFRDARDRMVRMIEMSASDRGADRRLAKVLEDYVIPSLDDPLDALRVRATIHVPDPLLQDALTQYLDYYGDAKGGHGRVFTTRFGIIGRAWRLREDQIEGDVSRDEKVLVANWSMTPEETRTGAGKGRQSFMALILEHEGISVGIFYMDAVLEKAFNVTGLAETAKAACLQEGLTESVSHFYRETTLAGPRVRVLDE
jgi:hypothetical protein